MHVGVFLDDKPALEGGGYTFIYDIAGAFLEVAASSSHRFTIFCPQSYSDAVSERLPANVKTQVISPRSFFERWESELQHASPMFAIAWRRPCRLERMARAIDIDMMWFVGGAYDTLGIPYFTTVWDLQHRTHPWFPEVGTNGVWEHREMFYSRHLGRATRVITGTEVGMREIVQFYGVSERLIRILPHPTPRFSLAAAQTPDSTTPRGLTRGYFFYPAQFWAHKNHANLLLGYRLFCDKNPDAPLLVFSGSQKGNYLFIKSLVDELNLDSYVRMLGFVSVEEVVALYRNACALVYASFSGPENLPPLEAFALGCPVAASDFPGAREQLGDAALLFDPHDPQAICEILMRLFSDAAIREGLIAKGHRRALRWTSENFVNGVFAAMDEFAAERRAWQN